jgi:proteasome assembly chaperone (PAC2) family protein
MGIELFDEPQVENPTMLCGWPGIGNIGIIAVDSLRNAVGAREFGRIEPWDFFEPQKVCIERGLLSDLEFPSSKFYCRRVNGRDLIFFIGREQPGDGRNRYAEGQKAYEMAELVMDVAAKFGCRRVYTSGAGVTQVHHTVKPRVWAVPNTNRLVEEIRDYDNTVLMSQIEGRGSQGVITGLNGLLLGVAKKRGIEAMCLMGEIPYYLQGLPWPYPKASRAVLEVLSRNLGVRIDLHSLDEWAQRVDRNIEKFLESLYRTEAIPPQVKQEIERLRDARPTVIGPITEEEQKRIMEHIDELFKSEGWHDERDV